MSAFRRPAVLLACVCLAWPARGGAGPGTSGADLLKVSVGSRHLAMASAETALRGDLAGVLANPALLSLLGRRSIMFMHWPGIAEMRTEFLSYSLPAGKVGTWAGTVLFRTFPAIDNEVPGEAPVEVSDGMLMMSLGRGTGKGRGHLGASIKLFNSALGDVKATSVAADIGAAGRAMGTKYFRYGVSVNNIGAPIKHEEAADALPLTVRAGLSYERPFEPHHLTVSWDMRINVEQDLRVALGLEWMQAGRLGLRAGGWYRRFAARNFSFPGNCTFGAGWRFSSTMLGPYAEYNLDYAFLPFALLTQDAPTHAFSVFIRF